MQRAAKTLDFSHAAVAREGSCAVDARANRRHQAPTASGGTAICQGGGVTAHSGLYLSPHWHGADRQVIVFGVAAKSALNAKNLEALGSERPAVLLIEISADNAAAKRRLRMELAGAQSPAELARALCQGNRIARKPGWVGWRDG
jgi:hypothetical protein